MADRLALNGLMGAIIGNYRVERLVEQEKWGAVLQVYAESGTRYLMHFCETVTARPLFLAHFQQEVKLIAALRHPNILPLLDYGNFHGRPYLVYPQLALRPFFAELAEHGAPSPALAGHYLQQITSALDYAHQHGVLHRNLAPACISLLPGSMQTQLLTEGQPMVGHLLIGEFGCRRIIELSRTDLRTDADSFQPRPAYDGNSETSAPEQLLGQPIDTYTDVYACGVLLYHILTGHAPFEGETRAEVARQHLYARLPPLHVWRKDVPGVLNHVVQKAMAKDPAQRYRRPAELAQAYQAALQAAAGSPAPTPTEVVAARLSVPRVRQGRVSRRRVLALAGAGSGVVAAGLFAGMRFLQGQSSSPAATSAPRVMIAQGMPPATQTAGKPPASNQKVMFHVGDVPLNAATTFPLAQQQQPGILVHLPDNRFVAFDSTCTHAGCGVEYNAQTRLLECPCHGAAFDPAQKAAVVSGPAQSPLAAINIQVNTDGTITLQ